MARDMCDSREIMPLLFQGLQMAHDTVRRLDLKPLQANFLARLAHKPLVTILSRKKIVDFLLT